MTASAQSTAPAGSATTESLVDLQPLLAGNTPWSGYFSDPYPIHLAPWLQPLLPQSISGTTKYILTSGGAIRAECFNETPFTVAAGDELQAQAESAATTIAGTFENSNIYEDRNGEWQMATTMYFATPIQEQLLDEQTKRQFELESAG